MISSELSLFRHENVVKSGFEACMITHRDAGENRRRENGAGEKRKAFRIGRESA